MDDWLVDVKERAKSEAKDFIENMNDIANRLNIEPIWFIEEVVKNIHQLKESNEWLSGSEVGAD